MSKFNLLVMLILFLISDNIQAMDSKSSDFSLDIKAIKLRAVEENIDLNELDADGKPIWWAWILNEDIYDNEIERKDAWRYNRALFASGLIADICARDRLGGTALHHFSRRSKSASIIKFLLESGIGVDIGDVRGNTALGDIFHQDSMVFENSKILLAAGADIRKKLELSHTILERAAFGDGRLFSILITHSCFFPRPSPVELSVSQERIWTVLLCLKRRYPLMPRDVRKLILCADDSLRHDVLNCPTTLCKDLVYAMPLEIVKSLISSRKLVPEQAVNQLKKHKISQLFPLVSTIAAENALYYEVLHPELAELSNPNNLDARFGREIEDVLMGHLQSKK